VARPVVGGTTCRPAALHAKELQVNGLWRNSFTDHVARSDDGPNLVVNPLLWPTSFGRP
jgi:hypothetical protein